MGSKVLQRIRRVVREVRGGWRRSLPDLSSSWRERGIPAQQAAMIGANLSALRRGEPHVNFSAVRSLLRQIPSAREYTFLDVACAYGYYSEVLSTLLPELKIDYLGGDVNAGMLALAKRHYPGLEVVGADVERLPFADRSIDIVFSSATISHLRRYQAGLAELTRVCRTWLVLHRIDIEWRRRSFAEVLHHFDVDIYAHHVNRRELLETLDVAELDLVASEPLSPRSLLGRQAMSFLFRRRRVGR